MSTNFSTVYNRFLGKITDDMYIELTPEDTIKDLRNMLVNSLPSFEFPRFDTYNYKIDEITKPENEVTEKDFVLRSFKDNEGKDKSVIENSCFAADLTDEEEDIIAILMKTNWVQRQVTSIEVTRMKYSGADFKMTSQANHLQKLMNLLGECKRDSQHMQRLYKRRRPTKSGIYESNWSVLREVSALDD